MVNNFSTLDPYRPLTVKELVDSKNKKKVVNFIKKSEDKILRSTSSLGLKLKNQNRSLKNFRFLKEAYTRFIKKDDSGLKRYSQQRTFFQKLSYIKRQSKTLFDLVLKMSTGTRVLLKELYFTKIQFKDSQANVLDFFYKKYKRPYRWIFDLTFLLGYSYSNYLKWSTDFASISGQRGSLTLLKAGLPLHSINNSKTIANYLALPSKITKDTKFFSRFLKSRLVLNINSLEYVYLTGYQLTQTFNNFNVIKLYSKRDFVYTYFNYKYLQIFLSSNKNSSLFSLFSNNSFENKKTKRLLAQIYSTRLRNAFFKKLNVTAKKYLLKHRLPFRIKITNFIKPHCFNIYLPFFPQKFFLFSLFPNVTSKKVKIKLVSRRSVKFPLNNLIVLQFPNFCLIDYSLFSFCFNNNAKKPEISLQLEHAFPNAYYYPIWFRSCYIY